MRHIAGRNGVALLLICMFFSLLWQAGANSTVPSPVTTNPTTELSTTLVSTTILRPDNVNRVNILAQTESTITLSWTKVNNILTYFLHYTRNGSSVEEPVIAPESGTSVSHTVSRLIAATDYNFTLFTSSDGQNSTGYSFRINTAPPDVPEFKSVGQNESSITLQWTKVDRVFNYTLKFGGREEYFPALEDTVTRVIPGLSSATIYTFSLFSVYENITSRGVNLIAATAPADVENVTASARSETSITLKWIKVDNASTYSIQYKNTSIPVVSKNQTLVFYVTKLSAGTTYDFKLFSEFQNISSTGLVFNASTFPSPAAQVNVIDRSENNLTVTWRNVNKDWKYRLLIDGQVLMKDTESVGPASIFVTGLEPGNLYNFNLTTVFDGLWSSPYEGYSLTTIDCARVRWQVTTSKIHGVVKGLFTTATATNGTKPHVARRGQNVTFTGLYPGATYDLSLEYKDDSKQLLQCHQRLQTNPPFVNAICKYSSGGYSIVLVWDQPQGHWDSVDIEVQGKNTTFPKKNPARYSISGLQPAKKYELLVTTVSGGRRTASPRFLCQTDPRGVIAGSVVGVVIFAVLVLIIFMVWKKGSFSNSSTKDKIKNVRISAPDFPDYYRQLSADDNRGFSELYEDLFGVGVEQSQHVAIYPDNQVKNRFTNILPYDGTRVKLSGKSDYINANFIPGYHHDQEYIATQGPLPNTVSDFWRMIWEQRVRGIVMVTNCVELTRTKCEQYWPPANRSCLHGDLLVSVESETEETNWTLKDITVTHKSTSEQRTVKHFHFTAWPDHGVPQTTDVLIQFRRLVRQHIDEERSRAPTVVHCSAGVGRTGTIIALDVLLQQLQQEKAVDIHGFVHKMRLRRNHMVQTEAQYVYLHQCILDSLPSQEQQEYIYENADMIYVNATALRELR